MRLILLFSTLCFFVACQSNDSYKNVKSKSIPTSHSKHLENGVLTEDKDCTLKVDTFSFKGICLGATRHTLKNIKITNTEILVNHTNVFDNLEELNNSSRKMEIKEESIDASENYFIEKYGFKINATKRKTYEVTNAKQLTIFNTAIDKIYLRFYSDTLYQIIIFPTESIVELIAAKFNGRQCMQSVYDFKKIYLSNKNISIESESCAVSDKNTTDLKNYSHLIITNKTITESYLIPPEKKREKNLNDF